MYAGEKEVFIKWKRKQFRGLLKSFSSRRMISTSHLENKQQIYHSTQCLPRCLTLLICLGSHHDILSLSRRGMGWSQNLSLWGKSRCRTGEPSVVGTRARRWQDDQGTSWSRTSSPDNSQLLAHPCRNPPLPTVTTRVREGHRYPLSNLSGCTITSGQLPGKNIFSKLHLNQPVPLVNHNKQHFGKRRHFLLWRNKSFVLQDSNLFLLVLCSDFTSPGLVTSTFWGLWAFGRTLGTAGDRTPICMEICSYTVWPFFSHKWAEIHGFHCSLALHHHTAL